MIRLELDFFGMVLQIKLDERDRHEEVATPVNADPPLTEYADPASVGFTGTSSGDDHGQRPRTRAVS